MKKIAITCTLTLFAFLMTSCDTDTDAGCSAGYLECDNDKCCPASTPYNDGHGSCYSSLQYCRQSGFACMTCW